MLGREIESERVLDMRDELAKDRSRFAIDKYSLGDQIMSHTLPSLRATVDALQIFNCRLGFGFVMHLTSQSAICLSSLP